ENDRTCEREKLVHFDHLLELLSGFQKESARSGKQHAPAEVSADDEKQRGDDDEWRCIPALTLVEPRRNEQPQLPQNHRRGDEDAGEKRYLHVQHEGLGQPREHELFTGRKELCQRLVEPAEDTIGEVPADQKRHAERDKRDDQPFAKFLEMLEERHLRKLALFVLRSRGEIRGGRISHGELQWCNRFAPPAVRSLARLLIRPRRRV